MMDSGLTWKGESSIDFQVSEATKNVIMHAHKNLVIDEHFTELIDTYDNKYKPIKHIRNEELEFLTIEFANDILIGNYTLNLKYEGTDEGENDGFYKASRRGEPIVAATLFEPTKARRAFPCWDEPALKAQFRLSVKHDRAYTAISNMPINETIETLDGKNLTKFETTPLMSTYLLTFVIANYTNVSNEHGNVTIWASENLLEDVQHVLDTSQKIVDVMESYTGLSFGLPIVGSVVVPTYSFIAMENWGLVSYREDGITFNQTTDTATRLDKINLMIAHELSHTWFGNRVTPRWWNGIWLSEAFATYFQYYIMDQIYGNSDSLDLFIVENNQEISFPGDIRKGNVHVKLTPITNIEIERSIEAITHSKGTAIVHMFRNVLTDDVFQAGIRKFLTKYSFQAADTDDFMKSFQDAYDENNTVKPKLNVHDTMMTWLIQSGYPMINVTRNYTTGNTKVTQGSALIGENSQKRWWIPLNYATKTNLNFSSTTPSSWISDMENFVTIREINVDDWVIFNVQSSGYYRVNYDEENWKRLVEYLNTDNYKNIHILNRAQLISDAYFIAQREPSRYGEIFRKLIKYISREVDYVPWAAAKNIMRSVEYSLRGIDIHRNFTTYITGLMESLVKKIGYDEIHDEDNHMTKLSKENLVGWACTLGHPGCAELLAQQLLRFIEIPLADRPNTENLMPIFCIGLRVLNDTALQRLVEWTIQNDKILLSRNIQCTENRQILQTYLDSKMAEEEPGKLYFSFNIILKSSEENFNFAIDYLTKNHEAMKNTFIKKGWNDLNIAIVKAMPQAVTSNSRLEKFKKILDLNAFATNAKIVRSDLLQKAEQKMATSRNLVETVRQLWGINHNGNKNEIL